MTAMLRTMMTNLVTAPTTRPARTLSLAQTMAALRAVVARDAPDCSCGHDHDAHEHYRSGSDCALCSCAEWTTNS